VAKHRRRKPSPHGPLQDFVQQKQFRTTAWNGQTLPIDSHVDQIHPPPSSHGITESNRRIRLCSVDPSRPFGERGFVAVFPNVEVRHLHAVIVLAEELNFTRGFPQIAHHPVCTQQTDHRTRRRTPVSPLSSDKLRVMELIDAGRIFGEEARSALLILLNFGNEAEDQAVLRGCTLNRRFPPMILVC
jgi:hypothetical protein